MNLGDAVTDPDIIKSLEAQAAPVAPASPQANSDIENQNGYTGLILPIHRDAAGNISPAVPRILSGLYDTVTSAVTAPGDAYEGRIPMVGPNGGVSPEAVNRAMDFAQVFSPSSVAMRAGEMIPGEIAAHLQAPTAPQLKTAAAAGYDAARASPEMASGLDVAAMARQMQNSLQSDHGVIAKTAPKTYAILDELGAPPSGAVATYPGLEAARRGLSSIAGEGGTEGFAAQKAIPMLDSFIDKLAPEAADARANYAAAMRSNQLTGVLDNANTGILERAEARAHASNSGTNIDNAIRQRIASLMEKPDAVAGYSPAEIALMNQLVQGGAIQNAARRVGNVLGGGGGLGQLTAMMGGALMGGHLMGGSPEASAMGAMVPSAVGVSAKSLENALSRRFLNQLDDVVRRRSPLYQAMAAQPLRPNMGANAAVGAAARAIGGLPIFGGPPMTGTPPGALYP